MNELKYRLRIVGGIGDDAADFIEQQAAEIERLKDALDCDRAILKARTESRDALQAKLSAMEKQEPVLQLAGIDDYGPKLAWYKHWTEFPDGTELYTAPQERKPLTDEQCRDIWHKCCAEWLGAGNNPYLSYARSIEAAHNIGGQQP